MIDFGTDARSILVQPGSTGSATSDVDPESGSGSHRPAPGAAALLPLAAGSEQAGLRVPTTDGGMEARVPEPSTPGGGRTARPAVLGMHMPAVVACPDGKAGCTSAIWAAICAAIPRGVG